MRAKKEFEFMNKYKLSSDPLNIILQEKRTVTGTGKKKPTVRKVGDVFWSNIAYFSTPENALKYVIQKEIKESWVDDLKELVKEVSKLEKMIDGLSFKSLPQIVQ
jgi:hypothetical protein